MTTINPADLGRVARAIPDALRPSWLEETWSGVHGAGGLRSEVDDVHAKLTLTPQGMKGTSTASGLVYDGDREVGTFTRDQKLHSGGRLEVHHSYLKLEESAHGTGFARAFNDHAFARYADAGVDDVTILAALTVGGYAWARQGFELVGAGSSEAKRLTSRALTMTALVDKARSTRSITADQHARLEPRLHRGGVLAPDALVSVAELAAMPELGRAVLIGRSWEGARPIERTQAWWAGRAPGGLDAARVGVSHLTHGTEVAKASGAAARHVAAALPTALDPAVSSRSFERALSGIGGGAVVDAKRGAMTVLRLRAGDGVSELSGRTSLRTDDGGTILATIKRTPAGVLVGKEKLSPTLQNDATRRAMDDAWRELGIQRVQDAPYGAVRMLD